MRIKKINDFNNIQIVEQKHEDGVKLIAKMNEEEVGYLNIEILMDPYSYEFSDTFDEDEFYELYPDDVIVKLSYMEVKIKNMGIGTKLMEYAMDLMKKEYNQFYLNASPMGFDGLNIHDLVDFYSKFGFETLLDQGHNVQMMAVFQK